MGKSLIVKRVKVGISMTSANEDVLDMTARKGKGLGTRAVTK